MYNISNTMATMKRVGKLMDDRDYPEALELIEAQLQNKNLPDDCSNYFLYRKGIALDCTRKPFEALEIFLSLHEKYPYSAQYLTSLRIVLRGIARMTMDLIERDPSSELIQKYEETMAAIDACPSLIRLHVAVQRALNGEVGHALKLITAYLELSPNDADYLITAVRIADIANEQEYKSELLERIQGLVIHYPHNHKLKEFLEGYEDLRAS
jgi:tetratricopeptide (TPR) repeat protein